MFLTNHHNNPLHHPVHRTHQSTLQIQQQIQEPSPASYTSQITCKTITDFKNSNFINNLIANNQILQIENKKLLQSKKTVKLQRTKICKLKKELKKFKNQCTCKKERKNQNNNNAKRRCLTMMKEFVTDSKMYNFIATQIRLCGNNKFNFRYTMEEKSCFLSLYSASPKCYKLLRKLITLPSVRTLQKMLQKLNFNPGFHEVTLKGLSHKTKNMTETEKLCVLLMDEISLKEAIHYDQNSDRMLGLEDYGHTRGPGVANHALVFMIRGLTTKWKQPFAYFLSNGTIKSNKLKTLVIEAIRQISATGLNCVSLVCDQGANNQSVINQLGVTISNPYFLIDKNKINVIFDPPHALKNVRNNLKSSDFVLDNTPISWSIIEETYFHDSQRNSKMIPKITDKHLSLQGFGTNMRVRLAAQILSHSVASAINTLAELKIWKEEKLRTALKTAEFIENFNNLFDIFNSKSFSESKPFSKPLSNNIKIWNFLDSCLIWLHKLKQKNKPITYQLPCIKAWQININSVKDLWQRLSCNSKINLKFLMTNRLNQDALENFFSLIRAKNRNDDRPDSVRFHSAFRSLSFESIFNLSKLSNCENDNDFFLLKPDDYYSNITQSIDLISDEHAYAKQISNNTVINDNYDLIETNSTAYIAGYLVRKFLDLNNCNLCKEKLTSSLANQAQNDKYIFIRNKQYSNLTLNSGLKIPSESFVSLVESFNKLISFNLNLYFSGSITKKITQLCYNQLNNYPQLFCGQDLCMKTLETVTKLFIKIKIHFAVKEVNQAYKHNNKKNKKLLKISHQ